MGRATARVLLVVAVIATTIVGDPRANIALAEVLAGNFEIIRFRPNTGSAIEFQGRRYRGEIEVRRSTGGLVVIEHTNVDGYLEGIAEVPFAWPEEALAAQAVAARTYLAYTLSGGRRGAGADHSFDICASSACQVYAGVGLVEGPYGERWEQAVHGTADEILVYDGRPAETYYHSTSGGRTEAVQDVWEGATPLPYLQGAESPGERSPFVDWRVALPADVFLVILDEAGLGVGDQLLSIEVTPSEKGSGVWQARIAGDEQLRLVDVSQIRNAMNRYGDELFPQLLPARRATGRRYSQPILSYRFDAILDAPLARVQQGSALPFLPATDLPPAEVVVFNGNGWGHHIGMSQYGARSLADEGATYDVILGHFYGGLQPLASPGVLPETIAVGLAWGKDDVELTLDGPVSIEADGELITESASGVFSMVPAHGRNDVKLRAGPVDIDLPPRRFLAI